MNLQRLAAHHGRAMDRGGADDLGEEHLAYQLENFLEASGVNKSTIADQLDRLKMAD